jgi:hypothetical protein
VKVEVERKTINPWTAEEKKTWKSLLSITRTLVRFLHI